MTVRILVADDSITIQKIVAMAFENEDAEVEGIGDGQNGCLGAVDGGARVGERVQHLDADTHGASTQRGLPVIAGLSTVLDETRPNNFDSGALGGKDGAAHV